MEIGWLNHWRVQRSQRTHCQIGCCCGRLLLSCLKDFLYNDAAAAVVTGLPPTGGLLGFNEANQLVDRLVLAAAAAQDLAANIVVLYA